MQSFRQTLQREYSNRAAMNSRYSLRAFAKHLGINHATLSSLLSGKRKITKETVSKLAPALNLKPADVVRFTKSDDYDQRYTEIQSDLFALMSDWYFDAILELARIPDFEMTPPKIAKSLKISELQARIGIDLLIRLDLLVETKTGGFEVHADTTNDLDPNLTTAAKIKYQQSVLKKSLEALVEIERPKRDHTSTTMAIDVDDMPEVKRRIREFRQSLDAFVQRPKVRPNQVYQLQVSFFPLQDKSDSEPSRVL